LSITLQGSADGTTWTNVDTRQGETFGERFQTNTYDVRRTGRPIGRR
jgi:hypothetical protein